MRVSIQVSLIKVRFVTKLVLLFFSFSYAGYTFDQCTKHDSASGLPYCLTTVHCIQLKYKIICITQNRAYHDCDFGYNNGINTCGNPSAGALNPCLSDPGMPGVRSMGPSVSK